MTAAWDRLQSKLTELYDLWGASKLLSWDQAVHMPPLGGPARARAVATLQAIAHERLTDPEIGDLLSELKEDTSLDQDRAASVRILTRDYEHATKVPEDLVRALAELCGTAYQVWTQARPASDFAMFEPYLSRMIDLKKEEADALGWEGERYDALLDQFEPEMTTAEVERMFAELSGGLTPIVDAVLAVAGDRPGWLVGSFDEERQKQFCDWLVNRLGFDRRAGRLDKSPHPFTQRISPGDVRQTIRTDPKDVLAATYAAIHETGHALYEQGIPEEMRDMPVGQVPSLGMHESQSRLWENHVGRSRPFTDFLLAHLKEPFEAELGVTTPEEFYRGVNHPRRSLIRVQADELTYNLHVVLRFELEIALFRDELSVADVPDAWDAAMEKHLGVRPDNHADGVLQDMHWSIGALGYFPTYTLGTLYAAALYRKAEGELGSLDESLRVGDTSRLLAWLRKRIHREAYRYPAKELGEGVLGEPVSAEPFISYLKNKYSALYAVTI